MISRRIASIMGALMLTLAAVGLTPMAAQAASAPSCVHLYQSGEGNSYATVKNLCSSSIRIRVIWAWAGDGACSTIHSGHTYVEKRRGKIPYVSSVQSC